MTELESDRPKQERLSVGRLAGLCKTGDINFRFSTRSSAREGIRGHQVVQRRRGEHYFPECSLSVELTVQGLPFELHGRADGIEIQGDRVCVEEIKTIRVPSEQVPDDVLQSYWFQACIYAYMIALHDALPGVLVRICLYHLDDGTEHLSERWFTTQELTSLFVDALGRFADIRLAQDAWASQRNRSLKAASFPYDTFRPGQRDMAVSVYRTVSEQGQMVMQAPTGLGKTMGTLYPAVQALTHDVPRRLFYLSARNSTQSLAESAIRDIQSAGAALRGVSITSKDKICFSKGEPCDPDHCRFAKGYYDRVPDAIDELLALEDTMFDRASIEQSAAAHEVCPFELTLDLSEWCDVIIGDYNYVFDPSVYLRRYFDDDRTDSAVLVDEAHNLVDRGRAMYSADVLKGDYLSLARTMKSIRPALCRSAQAVNREFLSLRKENPESFESNGHLVWRDAPRTNLIQSLQQFCESAEEVLANQDPVPDKDRLLEIYFQTLRFLRTAELFDDKFVLLLKLEGKDMRLALYCIDPSGRLQEKINGTASTVCFSATMQPTEYFKQMIGTSESCRWYRLPSPFPDEHLKVTVAEHIDTSYRGRDQSVASLVQLVKAMISARRGNYLVFFPSYRYLQAAVDAFVDVFPDEPVVVQQRDMSPEARESFLAEFDQGPVCGFAVMGSIFSEGIDLKGERLIGVMVVGTGLPQIGIDRNLIRDHFPAQGFDFAYRFPGMNRVLQTAGRVIRDAGDRGVVCLVDPRFSERQYRTLLPEEWQPERCQSNDAISQALDRFWTAYR